MKREAEKGPSVGVFYWISRKLYTRSKLVAELAAQSPGTLLSFSTHFSYWGDLRLACEEYMNKDDSYFPRGRVLFDRSKDIYLIRMDKCVPLWVMPTILQAFNLTNVPSEKLQITHGADPQTGDHHYQCFACGPQTRRRVL